MEPTNESQTELERCIRPLEQRMMRAVWRIVRDADDAEDAFQQALEKIWRQWDLVRRHPNPPALIMTICVHAAYDRVRQRARRSGHEVLDVNLDGHPERGPGADGKLATKETEARIHAAIGQLPAMQRGAISLRLLAGLSFEAIAQALGCSEATARTHAMRALRKLRIELAELNPMTHEEARS